MRHAQAASTVMAMDDDPLLLHAVEFAESILQFAHRQQHGPFNSGGFIFVGLAAIEQQKIRPVRLQLLHGRTIDFK